MTDAPFPHYSGSDGLTQAQQRALAQIWQVLPQARLVGGVVRDLLAQRHVADIDMATPEPPEQVQALLEAAGLKVVPTGLAHGTVTAVIASAPYEITTLRQDTETDGRHAVVCWTQDWREDAARRDFTINAMSRDRDGVLHDYFGGQADLAAGRVRFVGQARQRIEEDALRILRFFRFQGRYGRGQPDAEALTAICQHTGLLKRLSVERVWSELKRLITGADAVGQIALMAQQGVLSVLFPQGYRLEDFSLLVRCGAPEDAILRLACLLEGNGSDMARHLKLSRADDVFLKGLKTPLGLTPDMPEAALKCLLSDHPKAVLVGQTWLAQVQMLHGKPEQFDVLKTAFAQLRHKLEGLAVPVFPLAGRDLLARGVPPGPELGRLLGRVRHWWQQTGCTASREACLAQSSVFS